uniref:Uncharacterized protein n=1 Tax=Sus scrofa TaxID=9823 RepID=A0A8D0PIW9_PIG
MHLRGCGSRGRAAQHQIASAMSSATGPDVAEAPEERRFLSTAEAAALERELLEDYRFGRQQLVEWCGHASAVAVTKAGTQRPAATLRTGYGPTCWYPWRRPSAAPAASPGATTSWPAGSCPTTCAESSLCACQDTQAPNASRRFESHPRLHGLGLRQ